MKLTEKLNKVGGLVSTREGEELELYIDNTSSLYFDYVKPLQEKLLKEMEEGLYNREVAAKQFLNIAVKGVVLYNEEIDKSMVFTEQDKIFYALRAVEYFETEALIGAFGELKLPQA